MFFDRFDIVHSYYLFFIWNHGGQGCEMYSRLSTQILVRLKYKPGHAVECLLENQNQLEIFNALAEKNSCSTYQESSGDMTLINEDTE